MKNQIEIEEEIFTSLEQCKQEITKSLLMSDEEISESEQSLRISCASYTFINENTLLRNEEIYLDRGWNTEREFITAFGKIADRLLLNQAQKEIRKANRKEYLKNK